MAKDVVNDKFRQISEAAQRIGANAVKKTKAEQDAQDKKIERKMVQVAPDAHALAKKIAALDGVGMAEYIAGLIRADAEKRYPTLF